MRRLWLAWSLSAAVLLPLPFDFMSSIGMRAMSLSGSVSGIIDDPTMMFYNPAVLGVNRFAAGTLGYTYYGEGLSLLSGGYVYRTPIGTFGTGFGALGNFFGMKDGRLKGITTGMDLENMTDIDLVWGIGYGGRAGFLSFGMLMKMHFSSLAGFNTTAFTGDFGINTSFKLLSQTARNDLMIGLVLRNFPMYLYYGTYSFVLPVLLKYSDSSGPSSISGNESIQPVAALTVSEYFPFLDTTFSFAFEVTPGIGQIYAEPSGLIKMLYGIDHYQQVPFGVRIGVDMFDESMLSPRVGMYINPNDFNFSWGLAYSYELFKMRWSLEYAMATSVSMLTRGFELRNGFGLMVRGIAMPVFNIPSEVLLYPDMFLAVNDKLSPKVVEETSVRVEAPVRKKYCIDIKRFTANDPVRAKQGFLEQVEQGVREKMIRSGTVTVFDERTMKRSDVNADLSCDIAIEGELLSFNLIYKHPRTQKVLLKNSLSQSITFDREKKSYDALKAVVRGGKVVLVTDESSAAENKDLAYVESLSQEGAKWISESVNEALAARIMVRCAVADAEVYLDRTRMGAIRNGAYVFRAPEGEHVISVTKAGYPPFATDPPLTVESGGEYVVNAELKQTDFYTAVNIYSFPEGRPVNLDDRQLTNKTSYMAKKVKGGTHQYFIQDARNTVRERALAVVKDMFYNVYEVFSVSDDFRRQNKLLWRRLAGDDSVNVQFTGSGLVIQGRTEDSAVTGNGVVSPLFTVNGIVEIDISFSSSSESKATFYAGLIDEGKRGYLMRYQGEAISKQTYGFENSMEQAIPASRVLDPGAMQKVRIVYDFNAGTASMTANETKLYDEKFTLARSVRFILSADSLKDGDGVSVTVDNIRIENY
ncbi:MAG: hypothetical protein AABZ39_09670 [Spirochaetota bacterium]